MSYLKFDKNLLINLDQSMTKEQEHFLLVLSKH